MSVFRHLHAERVVWLEEHCRAVVDETGKTVRLVGVVQNITERKRAEEALRESEERFRAIFDSGMIGIVASVTRNNTDGFAVESNRVFLDLVGTRTRSWPVGASRSTPTPTISLPRRT